MTTNSKHFRALRTLRTGTKLAALALLPMALAGCKHLENDGTQVAGWSLAEATERHPIMVSQQPSTLSVRVPRGSQGLSAQQRADLVEFASKYRAGDAGNSRLVVAAPSGSANESDAMAAVDEIRGILVDAGFSEGTIAVEAYHAEAGGYAPVKVSYQRYVAEGPECGRDWSKNLADTSKNLPGENFGCANQRNFAAMIDNPADLLGPRSSGIRYGARREVVFSKWAKGQTTGASKTGDERITTQGGN